MYYKKICPKKLFVSPPRVPNGIRHYNAYSIPNQKKGAADAWKWLPIWPQGRKAKKRECMWVPSNHTAWTRHQRNERLLDNGIYRQLSTTCEADALVKV